MQEEKTDITGIDELDEAAEALTEKPADPGVPEHLVKQPCGLPKILMDKAELIQYEKDHGITVEERKVLQITDAERQLYEIYSQARRSKRVTKEHFVAALRMSHSGWTIHPKKGIDLNDMKVL